MCESAVDASLLTNLFLSDNVFINGSIAFGSLIIPSTCAAPFLISLSESDNAFISGSMASLELNSNNPTASSLTNSSVDFKS